MSWLTPRGPVQLEDVPQVLRGVLDVDARAGGGHGPRRRRLVHAAFVSLPPRTVQPHTALPGPDSRTPVTKLGPPAARKPPPALRRCAPPAPPTASTSGPPELWLPEPAQGGEERFRAGDGSFTPPGPFGQRVRQSNPFFQAEAEQMSTYWTDQIPVHIRTSSQVYVHYQNMYSLIGFRTGSI